MYAVKAKPGMPSPRPTPRAILLELLSGGGVVVVALVDPLDDPLDVDESVCHIRFYPALDYYYQ